MSIFDKLFKRKRKLYEFEPDYTVPPSESIKDSMRFAHVTTNTLWLNSDLPNYKIAALLADEVKIDMPTANELSKVIGGAPAFWMALSKNYHDKEGGKDA